MGGKIEKVEVTIVYHKGASLALMASEKPRLVTDKETGIEASGQMIHFAPEVQGVEGSAMSLDKAFAPVRGADQKQTLTLDAADGVICNPAGANLAAMVLSGEISVVCAKARLPEIKGYQSRDALLKQADRDARVVAERGELDALRARLSELEIAQARA